MATSKRNKFEFKVGDKYRLPPVRGGELRTVIDVVDYYDYDGIHIDQQLWSSETGLWIFASDVEKV